VHMSITTDLNYRSRGCFLELMYDIRLCCHRCLKKKSQTDTKDEVKDQVLHSQHDRATSYA
jgi:hypothetical protein